MDTCIFCRIVKGELPAYKVYEDEKFLGFLDIHPITPGHMLLVPKIHHEWIQDVPNDTLGESFVTAKDLIIKIKAKLGADYVQLSVIGKDVPHFHIHLVPRKLSEGIEGWLTQNPDKKDMEAIMEKINN